MLASDILDRVIDLSLGQNDVSEEERLKFLGYLQLALNEFYEKTASMDEARCRIFTQDNVDESSDITILDADGRPLSILYIKKITTPTFEFKKENEISWSEMQERKFLGDAGKPVYCVRDHLITLYSRGYAPYRVFISFIPALTIIIKEDTDLSAFMCIEKHGLLIYGTLYYIYQDMDGFKSSVKESLAAQEWRSGLSNAVIKNFNASRVRKR